MSQIVTTETPIEIEPRDWQDILGYIRALEERVMKLEAQHVEIQYGAPHNTNEECQTHTCSYYDFYLMQGPADLIHEAYHAAERQCERAGKVLEAWLREHEHDDEEVPAFMVRESRRWEKAVRA